MTMRKIVFLLFTVVCLSACHSQSSTKTSQNISAGPTQLYSTLYFDAGSAEIKDESTIHNNARWLKANPDKVIVLEGHCDERGDRDYNLSLGDRRARVVMKALMELNVPENQLIIVSYGKDRPIIKSHSEKGWAQNRRVEFVLR